MFGDMTRNQFLSSSKNHPIGWFKTLFCMVKSITVKFSGFGLRENLQETIDFPIKYGVNQSIEKSHFWRAEFSGETHSSEQRRL